MTDIEKLQEIIMKSDNIVFFGGAGVSTESGIPDFRSVDGLYNEQYKYPPETMLSREFYESHTAEFYDFYRKKMLFPDKKPNKAHFKLAELEKAGKLKAVVTQNIDGLHQTAGSKEVLELHGSVKRNYCMRCAKLYDETVIQKSAGVPHCSCGGIIKPDVVLYGEQLNENTVQRAVYRISEADVLIVGGTSLVVYPAAGLLSYFGGGSLILINRAPTDRDKQASLLIKGSIGEVLGQVSV